MYQVDEYLLQVTDDQIVMIPQIIQCQGVHWMSKGPRLYVMTVTGTQPRPRRIMTHSTVQPKSEDPGQYLGHYKLSEHITRHVYLVD